MHGCSQLPDSHHQPPPHLLTPLHTLPLTPTHPSCPLASLLPPARAALCWTSAATRHLSAGPTGASSRHPYGAPYDNPFRQQSGAVEACWAHNPEVRGSKPCSARHPFDASATGSSVHARRFPLTAPDVRVAWPSGPRRWFQVPVSFMGRGFESHRCHSFARPGEHVPRRLDSSGTRLGLASSAQTRLPIAHRRIKRKWERKGGTRV